MSVIARFRRSLGFSPGGNPSSETCSTSPVRAQQALETGDILIDEGHDKEQHNIFADMPGPSSQSSVAKTSNSSPEGSSGPVLAYFVLESSTGVEKVRYPIRKRVTKIGRLPVNDIRIYRETVSRLHCEVLVEGDFETPGERIIILLVHNTRGVRINAEAVERPADGSSAKQPVSIRLHEGDVLEIYRNFFRVRQPSFHSYSRNTSPIAQRQPLSSLMPSSSRIVNSPDRTSQAQKLPSSPAAPAGISNSPPDLLRSDVPRVLKGRRSLFTATPKREIQRSTPWTAEPVKSRALRRIPSGGHEPSAEPDELPTLKPDEASVDKAHATAPDRCGEHSDADFFGTEAGAFDEAQGGIAVAEKPAIDHIGGCQDLEESVHERESDQRQEKRRAKTPEAIGSAHEEVGSSQSARPRMRRSQSLSPKKPRRRSTFFGRAGVFANWNFGFYPEERRDQEAAERQVALDETNEMPIQPLAFDDGEVARPLTPISMPQPRLDESGRPRLPRSISSPDMRAGSPKKRVVSLRTATLLRAGQQAFEQQKLRSPPASPKRPARRPYRFSYIVAPVVTPDDEDDAAEVDESLSLLEAEDETKQRHEPETTRYDVPHTSSAAEPDKGVMHGRQEAVSSSPATYLPELSSSIAAAAESVIVAGLSVQAIDQPHDGVESCGDCQEQAQAADAIDKVFAEGTERNEEAVLDATPVNVEFADNGHRLHQKTFAQDDIALRAQETSAKHERKQRQSMPAKVKGRKSRRVSKVLPLPTDMLLPSRDDAVNQRAECSVARSAPKECLQGTDDVAVDATAVSDAKHIQDPASTADDDAVDVADEDGPAEVVIPHAEVNGHLQVEQHPTESTSHTMVTEERVLAQDNATTSKHEAIQEAPETTKAVAMRKTRARPAKKAALAAITVSSPEKAAASKDDADSVASTEAASSSSPTKRRARAAPKSAMSQAAEYEEPEEAAGQRPSVPVEALATEGAGPTKRSTRSTRRTKKQASEDASPDTAEATVELKADAKTEDQTGGSTRSRRAPARKAAPKRAAASKPAANDENDPSTVAPVRMTRSRAARARA